MFMSETSTMFSGWWLLTYFFNFTPIYLGFHDPIWRAFFSKGVNKPPTSNPIWPFFHQLVNLQPPTQNRSPWPKHSGFIINRPESFGQSTLPKKRGEIFGRHSWAGRLGNLIGGEAWKLDISHGCILLAISHGRMDSHGCMISRWWQLKQTCFILHLYLGRWSKLTNIFPMGWNHQLGIFIRELPSTIHVGVWYIYPTFF